MCFRYGRDKSVSPDAAASQSKIDNSPSQPNQQGMVHFYKKEGKSDAGARREDDSMLMESIPKMFSGVSPSRQDLSDTFHEQKTLIDKNDSQPKRGLLGRFIRLLFSWTFPDGSFRKAGRDLYNPSFVLALILFLFIIIFLDDLTGQGSIFQALSRSYFSRSAVVLIVVHTVILVTDRVFYRAGFKALLNNPFKDVTEGGEGQLSKLTIAKVQSARSEVNMPKALRHQYDHYLFAMSVKTLLTLIELIWLHTQFISNASEVGVGSRFGTVIGLQHRFVDVAYYLLCLAYLSVSILQLRDGPSRVYTDTLRPPAQYRYLPDLITRFRFAIVRSLPFVDEFRVLTDWTVSRTTLDLYQYFKLEDAHSTLFRVKRLMDVRRMMYPNEARHGTEKCYQGWLSVIGLAFLILLPVLAFSSFAPLDLDVGVEIAQVRLIATLRRPSEGQAYKWTLFHDQIATTADDTLSDLYSPTGSITELEGAQLEAFLAKRAAICLANGEDVSECTVGKREVIQELKFSMDVGALSHEGLGPPSVQDILDIYGGSENDLWVSSEIDLSWELSLYNDCEEISNFESCKIKHIATTGVCATSAENPFATAHFGMSERQGQMNYVRPFVCSTEYNDLLLLETVLLSMAALNDQDTAFGHPELVAANVTQDRPTGTFLLPVSWPLVGSVLGEDFTWHRPIGDQIVSPRMRLHEGSWSVLVCEKQPEVEVDEQTIDNVLGAETLDDLDEAVFTTEEDVDQVCEETNSQGQKFTRRRVQDMDFEILISGWAVGWSGSRQAGTRPVARRALGRSDGQSGGRSGSWRRSGSRRALGRPVGQRSLSLALSALASRTCERNECFFSLILFEF